MSKKSKKERILNYYIRVVKSLNRDPLKSEFINKDYTESAIRHHFGSVNALRESAREKFPKVFENLVTEELFTPTEFKKIKGKIGDYKRFVISTVVSGCDVDKKFWKSIKSYCKKNKAIPLLLPMADPARPKQHVKYSFDPTIKDECIIFDDLKLNTNLVIRAIKLGAKQMRPFTSLKRMGNRSFVVASPKQEMEVIPSSKEYPRVMLSPGAITESDYTTEMYMSQRTAYLANYDHVIGALIVELDKNGRTFHTRQVQADSKGRFIDLGIMYDGNNINKINPSAFIMGDLHDGETDLNVLKCWKDVMKQLKPDYLVLHDIFNGKSISHHDRNKIITRARNADKKLLDLSKELNSLSKTLDNLSNHPNREVVIVKSNHDTVLDRWLEDGIFIKEPQNLRLALELAIDMHDGDDPLKSGLKKLGMKNNKTRFLQRDESFSVAGIELGYHGDQGANGGRGSLSTMETSFTNSVTAHTHQAKIMRGAWSVGTSTVMRVGYNQGPSSWTHTSCLVYPNGMRQLINVIEGKWRG